MTTPPSSPSRCPICGRATEPAVQPFCSKRCADVDLARWLGGVYRVATDEGLEGSDDDEKTS